MCLASSKLACDLHTSKGFSTDPRARSHGADNTQVVAEWRRS